MRGNGVARRLAAAGCALQECRWAEVARLWMLQLAPDRQGPLFRLLMAATVYHIEHGGTLLEVLERLPATLAEALRQELLKGSRPDAAAGPTTEKPAPR